MKWHKRKKTEGWSLLTSLPVHFSHSRNIDVHLWVNTLAQSLVAVLIHHNGLQ